MLEGRTMKRWSIILAGMVLFVPCMARGQLLFRDAQEHENYGITGYERYGTSLINRAANPRFDSFGNYLFLECVHLIGMRNVIIQSI